MTKLGMVLRELHRSEQNLAWELDAVAHRHKADHEIYYVARDVAQWSRQHLTEIAELALARGIELDTDPRTTSLTGELQGKLSELFGRRPEPALLLLADLRRLHQMAAGVSVDWELLAQGAQAKRDEELLALASRSHPETLRQLRWTNAMLKVLSPQALSS